MLADQVKTRLEATVTDLAGRVQTALELAELMGQQALPQAALSAFVVPAGQQARDGGEAIAGAFTQTLNDMVAIVLVLRNAGDVTGGKSVPKLTALIPAIAAVLAGWKPPDEDPDSIYVNLGPLTWQSAATVAVKAGVVFYQIEVAAQVQLRIIT